MGVSEDRPKRGIWCLNSRIAGSSVGLFGSRDLLVSWGGRSDIRPAGVQLAGGGRCCRLVVPSGMYSVA